MATRKKRPTKKNPKIGSRKAGKKAPKRKKVVVISKNGKMSKRTATRKPPKQSSLLVPPKKKTTKKAPPVDRKATKKTTKKSPPAQAKPPLKQGPRQRPLRGFILPPEKKKQPKGYNPKQRKIFPVMDAEWREITPAEQRKRMVEKRGAKKFLLPEKTGGPSAMVKTKGTAGGGEKGPRLGKAKKTLPKRGVRRGLLGKAKKILKTLPKKGVRRGPLGAEGGTAPLDGDTAYNRKRRVRWGLLGATAGAALLGGMAYNRYKTAKRKRREAERAGLAKSKAASVAEATRKGTKGPVLTTVKKAAAKTGMPKTKVAAKRGKFPVSKDASLKWLNKNAPGRTETASRPHGGAAKGRAYRKAILQFVRNNMRHDRTRLSGRPYDRAGHASSLKKSRRLMARFKKYMYGRGEQKAYDIFRRGLVAGVDRVQRKDYGRKYGKKGKKYAKQQSRLYRRRVGGRPDWIMNQAVDRANKARKNYRATGDPRYKAEAQKWSGHVDKWMREIKDRSSPQYYKYKKKQRALNRRKGVPKKMLSSDTMVYPY